MMNIQTANPELTSDDGHRLSSFVAMPSNPSGAVMVVVSEIFGLNGYIREVCKRLAKEGVTAIAPNLLDRLSKNGHTAAPFSYQLEKEAHTAMTETISVEDCLRDIQATALYAKNFGTVGILGFSYGATLGWLAASTIESCSYFCGYYGNRIHTYLEQKPSCPFDLIFGIRDPSLSDERLKSIHETIPRQQLHLLEGGHGFDCSDRFRNYNLQSSKKAFEVLLHGIESNLLEHLDVPYAQGQ